MPTVARLLDRKGREVVTITPEATTLAAARMMNAQRIGSLVVMERGSQVPSGIITERDILTRIVAAQKDPSSTIVRDAMTTPVITCEPDDPLDHIRRTMRERRVRHIPVIHLGRLAGLISIGDLNNIEQEILEDTVHMLQMYVQT